MYRTFVGGVFSLSQKEVEHVSVASILFDPYARKLNGSALRLYILDQALKGNGTPFYIFSISIYYIPVVCRA